LAPDLQLPLFEKDTIKDIFHSKMGFGDREWSRGVGWASIELLFLAAEQLLRYGYPLVTESNFYRTFDSDPARNVLERTGMQAVQVHCTASTDVLVARNASRNFPPALRPGHHVMPEEELRQGLAKGLWNPLEIPGPVVSVDTSEPDPLTYARVLSAVERELGIRH
jgi:hypothetical protein